MPKSKEYLSSSDDSDSDSDAEPRTKKKKTVEKKPESKKPESKKPEKKPAASSEEETKIQLSKMRFVSVNEFRGRKMVNIREYYEADGEMRPGRKGIALNVEQWQKLKAAIGDIDEALENL